MMLTRRAFFTRWVPLLIWMALIFTGSSDVLAGGHTSRFFVPFMRWLFGSRLSPDQIESVHFLFRKCGHLSEYAILCVLFERALAGLRSVETAKSQHPRRNRGALAILLSAFYAASDEFHQSFVPSRTASLHDVLIDTAGAAFGLCLYLLVASYLLRRHATGTVTPG